MRYLLVESKNRLTVTFVDFIPVLRTLGADVLEKHLAQCRRQIATLLSDPQVFINLDDPHNLRVCEDTLNSCSLYLTQIARVWHGVFSNTVFAKALGNIVAFLLDSIIRIILGTDDIREYDANISAKLIAQILMKMEELFKFDNSKQSSIHRFVESQYFRLKEVLFCLNASLLLIHSRWCSGKGPLAQWLQPNELRHLIKALFQASEQREKVLKIIG
uniref:WASH-7_N domain-containing protein n=1 Tax=Syphacia muris TaxID=451379 RepID=A0A0N5ARX0_9BILA